MCAGTAEASITFLWKESRNQLLFRPWILVQGIFLSVGKIIIIRKTKKIGIPEPTGTPTVRFFELKERVLSAL